MATKLYTFQAFDKKTETWVAHRKCTIEWINELIEQYTAYNNSLPAPRFVNIEYNEF